MLQFTLLLLEFICLYEFLMRFRLSIPKFIIMVHMFLWYFFSLKNSQTQRMIEFNSYKWFKTEGFSWGFIDKTWKTVFLENPIKAAHKNSSIGWRIMLKKKNFTKIKSIKEFYWNLVRLISEYERISICSN